MDFGLRDFGLRASGLDLGFGFWVVFIFVFYFFKAGEQAGWAAFIPFYCLHLSLHGYGSSFVAFKDMVLYLFDRMTYLSTYFSSASSLDMNSAVL